MKGAEGAPNKPVAPELGISIKTIEKHRQSLMRKLNIHETQPVSRATQSGPASSKAASS